MRSSRVPQVLSCGLAVLLAAGCTGDPEPPAAEPEDEVAPVPTAFEGEPPPGVEGEVLRYLHGDDADVHAILDDPMGVRISPVGAAFLISSGGADRHLLHDGATGETLWEGEARFRGFDTGTGGDPVLFMTDAEGVPFALDARGERVWEPAEEGDTYLDGVAVRYPDEWGGDEPHGEYTVLDADGDGLWEYSFTPPDDEDAEADGGSEASDEDGADPDSEETGDESPLGVPVAAWEDVVLLASGGPSLHAHSLDRDTAGEELWTVTGHDEDLGLPASAAVPAPQVLGAYELPDADADDTGDSDEDADDETVGNVLLLRWARPEAPSTLSAHDRGTGETLWTLEEPGTNPTAEPFDQAGAPGSLYDTDTGTLLLPQASGEATLVAVDLAEGEVLWGLEEDDVSISPAFTHAGLVYADSRTNDGGDEQLVFDAVTMDVVGDDMSAYVEAITESGHAILVQERQRFVFGPPPEDEPSGDSEVSEDSEPTEEPTGEPS